METQALLSTAYFGPVQWYQKLCRYGRVSVERYDSYRKQTYRNRCVIAAANGPQTLTVPVERGAAEAVDSRDGVCRAPLSSALVRDIRISDHGNWRHTHWNALVSSYSESPFFDYYADDIRPFFERRWTFLYDYNMDICAKMCELLDIHPRMEGTACYVRHSDLPGGCADFRDSIDPKHPLPDADFRPRRYYQVYERRHGFIANLSVLDLLFNMGPEGVFYLVDWDGQGAT